MTQSSLIKSSGTLQYEWDELQRQKRISSEHFEEKCAKFDKVGNLLEIRERDPEGEFTSTFTYDDLYQLKEEHGVLDASYTNDSLHNRLKKDDESYEVNPLNQLLTTAGATFTYDKNGNPIEMEKDGTKLCLSYDALDRLIMLERPGFSRTQYVYDESHRRISRKNFLWQEGFWHEEETERFLFFNKREIGCLFPDDSIKEFRVLGLGRGAELGASVAIEVEGKTFCPIHDHRGNIALLIDSLTKQPTDTYRYSAFGEEVVFGETKNPWRFSSKRIDPESGFVFFGRRYYSPEVGRFLTPDPLGFGDGLNLYSFVNNSPLASYDLFGESSDLLWNGIVRGSMNMYASDEMKHVSVQHSSIRESYEHRNDPREVLDSGIIVHPDVNSTFTQEYEESSIEFLNACSVTNFCEKYNGKTLKDPVVKSWNGLCNNQIDAYEHAKLVNNRILNTGVLICHNPSINFFIDCTEAFYQFLGLETKVDQRLRSELEGIEREFKENNITVDMEDVCHSQGAMTASNVYKGSSFQKEGAYEAHAKHITTFGAPYHMPGAINYAARGDWVAKLGYLHPGPRGNVTFCGKKQNPFSAHPFAGPSYQEALSRPRNNQESIGGRNLDEK